MAARKPYAGVYENMDFGSYVYHEYPKHIRTGDNGKFEVALNAQEEAEIVSRLEVKNEVLGAQQAILGPDIEKEKLILRCRELDIPINTKWSTAKLYSLVREAESVIDALPPEPYEYSEKKTVASKPVEEVSEVKSEENKDEETQRAALLMEARTLGINANHLWSVPRLKAAIADSKNNGEKETLRLNVNKG